MEADLVKRLRETIAKARSLTRPGALNLRAVFLVDDVEAVLNKLPASETVSETLARARRNVQPIIDREAQGQNELPRIPK